LALDDRSEKAKMLAGEPYRATGPELAADALRADRLLHEYNGTGRSGLTCSC
jgi:hypothetical protein